MTDEDGNRLYSMPEVARMLGLDRVTVWHRIRKIGAGRKVGRFWVFTAGDVEAVKNAPDRRRKEHRKK